MKNKLLIRFLSCIAIMAIVLVAGMPMDTQAATSTISKLTPSWKWAGTGVKPILCDAAADDFNISWPSRVNAAKLKASDVTITLNGQYGDSRTLKAGTDYTVTTTAKKTTVDLKFHYYSYTPVYTTMTFGIDDTHLTVAKGYDVNLTKTYDIASVYAYETQQGGGLDKEGTVVAHSYYGFSNLTSWEQILSKPIYTDYVVIDGTKQYVAKDENGKEYLTTDNSKAYSYDATAFVKPKLIGNTVYITERYN